MSKHKIPKPQPPKVKVVPVLEELYRVGGKLYRSRSGADKNEYAATMGIDVVLAAIVGDRVYMVAPEAAHDVTARDILP